MRVSREKAAENRERIVETAGRLFREKGFDGVGIDAIMSGAGLTHGGFYGHFASKDDLAAEALTLALKEGADIQDGFADWDAFVADYLSERHCADRRNGCAMAALGTDVARQGGKVRGALAAHMRRRLDRLTGLVEGETPAAQRRRALAAIAAMVGGLTLARAVDDPALSGEILESVREAVAAARKA